MIRSLPRERYRCHLLVPGDGPLVQAAQRAGATVIIDPWPSALRRAGREKGIANRLLACVVPLLLLGVVWRTLRVGKRIKPDIVHTNGTKAHLAGWGAALGGRAELVWHLRDVVGPGPLRSILRLLGAVLPSAIIANSRSSAAPMVGGVLARAIKAKMIVVYNGIDPAEFRPLKPDIDLAASLGLPGDAFVIGSVGALAPLKGHVHLIRALPAIALELPQPWLLLLGDEMYETLGHKGHRRFLEAEAARLLVADRVIFAGRRDDVAALYSLMDVVALPSVRPESFGRVVVEAMACGRPVIASRMGGPEEIIESPEVGTLVPPGDPAALAAAVVALARDPDRRRRMGLLARKLVASRFTLERHATEIGAIYEKLAARASVAGSDHVGEVAQ